MTQGWKSAGAYHMGLRAEQYKVAHAFVNKLPVKGKRSNSEKLLDEWALTLHGHVIVARVPANKSKTDPREHYAFSMQGWPTKTTLNRLNGVTMLAFGQSMFFTRKGKVYFGTTVLREVDPHEILRIPVDFKVAL